MTTAATDPAEVQSAAAFSLAIGCPSARPVFVDVSGGRAVWAQRSLTLVAGTAAALLIAFFATVPQAIGPSDCYRSAIRDHSMSTCTTTDPTPASGGDDLSAPIVISGN